MDLEVRRTEEKQFVHISFAFVGSEKNLELAANWFVDCKLVRQLQHFGMEGVAELGG